MMIMIAFSFYSAMGPWSPTFTLNHYSRPYGNRNIISGSGLVFALFCLCSLSLSLPTSGLLIINIMSPIGQLNNIVTSLGSPGLSGVICICNRPMCGSSLVSKHFFSMHFTNIIHVSTCPLLWW